MCDKKTNKPKVTGTVTRELRCVRALRRRTIEQEDWITCDEALLVSEVLRWVLGSPFCPSSMLRRRQEHRQACTSSLSNPPVQPEEEPVQTTLNEVIAKHSELLQRLATTNQPNAEPLTSPPHNSAMPQIKIDWDDPSNFLDKLGKLLGVQFVVGPVAKPPPQPEVT